MSPGSLPVLKESLERLLPGRSAAMQRVRDEVVEFGMNPLAKTLLITGPIGAGKSTLARTVGMVKRVAPLTEQRVRKYMDMTTCDEFGRIDLRWMPWYVELALTGLGESIAEVQLFGSVKGAFTGAIERAGVFESAMTGRMARGKEDSGTRLTGGVVFLDEIGDLSSAHQAKLLPVLSGGAFYRLGTEGAQDRELQYAGTTIAASWRSLERELRPDLYSRISANTVRLPGLDDRRDDFDLILDQLQQSTLAFARSEIDRIMRAEQVEIDRGYWLSKRSAMTRLSQHSRRLLTAVDWSLHGNMRGLAQVVQKIVVGGISPEHAIHSLRELSPSESSGSDVDTLLRRLMARNPDGQGLAAHLRAVEVEQRSALRRLLQSDLSAAKRLADALGLDESTLGQHAQQLDRRRNSRGSRTRTGR